MSKVFFEDIGMPELDIYLGLGYGTHLEQTAKDYNPVSVPKE
jgi:hypothetical protein